MEDVLVTPIPFFHFYIQSILNQHDTKYIDMLEEHLLTRFRFMSLEGDIFPVHREPSKEQHIQGNYLEMGWG